MTLFNRKCTVDEIENDGDSFYGTTLDTLSEMADLVPYGWRELFADLIKQLRASDQPHFAHIGFIPFTVKEGYMVVKTTEYQPVLFGILRKFRKRIGHTCRECGLPGTQRVVGLNEMPLCPGCYGKRRLRTDLKKLLLDIESAVFKKKGVYVETDIPARAMLTIPDIAWTTLIDPGSKSSLRCITLESLHHEFPRLKSLKEMLDKDLCGYSSLDFSSSLVEEHE